jgi:Zn-dependent peptidase ImmA (M78 family)
MTPPAWVVARRIVSELRIAEPPVALSGIMNRFGLKARYCFMDYWDGIYLGNGAILINEAIPLTRKRFTLAHEIGHRALKHRGVKFSNIDAAVQISFEDRTEERAANKFAAELLMPLILIKREWHQYSLEEMSKRYLVSQEAMSYRLREVGSL